MASEPVQPGTSSGLQAILEQRFKVSTMPSIRREEAAQRVRKKIEEDDLPCECLDISERPVRRRALVDLAGARVRFPEGEAYDRSYVGFIDPDVELQWGHPAYWVFIPARGDAPAVVHPTEFPEHSSISVRFVPVPRR